MNFKSQAVPPNPKKRQVFDFARGTSSASSLNYAMGVRSPFKHSQLPNFKSTDEAQLTKHYQLLLEQCLELQGQIANTHQLVGQQIRQRERQRHERTQLTGRCCLYTKRINQMQSTTQNIKKMHAEEVRQLQQQIENIENLTLNQEQPVRLRTLANQLVQFKDKILSEEERYRQMFSDEVEQIERLNQQKQELVRQVLVLQKGEYPLSSSKAFSSRLPPILESESITLSISDLTESSKSQNPKVE